MTKSNQSCESCSKEFSDRPEGSCAVTCNGPCGKAFHDLCANVNRALLDAYTANGLLWFCPACLVDYREGTQHWEAALQATIQKMSGRIQKLAARVESIEENCFTRQLNQGAIPAVGSGSGRMNPELPVEVWSKAFRNLKYEEWCNARFVSSQWRDIVDGDCSLMSKFIMRFPTIDQHFEQVPMLPASTIIFKFNEIATVGSWWSPRITEKLANLELDDCKISLMNLVAMLRHTPNLVSMSCCGSTLKYEKTVATFSNVQLQKLEKLTLGCVEQDEVMEVFNRMCPQLKDFALLSDYHKCYRGVLEMIKTVPSLEGISLVSLYDDLSHLVGVDHKFKRISIAVSTSTHQVLEEKLISFSQKQPLLEHFDLEIRAGSQSYVSERIFQNLLRLKRLSINYFNNNRIVNGTRHFNLQSIGCLSELEYLAFRAYSHSYTELFFTRARNPKLKELFLSNVYFRYMSRDDRSCLSEYIANAPNLSTITLDHCCACDLSDVFATIESKGLRRLNLHRLNSYGNVFTISPVLRDFEYLNELRYLELKGCTMTEQVFSTLFSLCSQLEELHLDDTQHVCDVVVLDLCLQLALLRKLTLRGCEITDASVKSITQYGLNLEQLTIENCKKLTTGGVTQLKAAKIAKVEIK